MLPQRIKFRCIYHIIASCRFCLKERIMHFRYMNAEQTWCWIDSGTHWTTCSMPCIIVIFEIFHRCQACFTTNNGTKYFPAHKDSFKNRYTHCHSTKVSEDVLNITFVDKSIFFNKLRSWFLKCNTTNIVFFSVKQELEEINQNYKGGKFHCEASRITENYS